MRKFGLTRLLQSPLWLGVTSVMLSMIFLATIVIVFWTTFFPEYLRFKSESNHNPLEIWGNHFTPVIFGNGGYQGSSSIITELADGEAVLSLETNFLAENYPFLRWKAQGLNHGLQIRLFWRNNDVNSPLHSTKLHFATGQESFFDLTKNPEWSGKIVELSVGIFGDLRSNRFVFEYLIFQPFSIVAALRTIPMEWASSNMWKHHSINYATGTVSRDHIPPALFFGLLLLLSLTCVKVGSTWFWNFDSSPSDTSSVNAYVTAVFLCWIGLDIPRMIGRFEQAVETHFLFAGKTLQERAAAAEGRCIVLWQYWDERQTKYRLDCASDTPLPNF
ncbi:MAG: hypothetical protein P8J18_09110 [Halieaceae bacterium]|nr:hypothetical protein [Halieaceae bacterium]